jgi:hypothetical protein
MSLTKYGQYSDIGSAKCIIFPEGKTTWKEFHRPFKDGDIIRVRDEYSDASFIYVAILKQIEKGGQINCHCFYNYEDDVFSTHDFLYDSYNIRFATEEEKEKLFKVIKDNGYKWNPESNTLEKLIESKEDTNEDIVMSGIYFDREYYADEVELHLGNYEIEVRDGKTYAVFKNQETKTLKPKFKVDDKIKLKGGDEFGIITQVSDCFYTIKCKNNTHCWPIKKQDDWELINELKFKVGDRVKSKINQYEYTIVDIRKDVYIMYYATDKFGYHVPFCDEYKFDLVTNKFEITTLKPFDKVLMRSSNAREWTGTIFSHYSNNKFYGCGMCCDQCIPYEGNEHLLGKTDDCDEYFKNLFS